MEWDKQFNSLMSSPLGEELVRALTEDVHDNLIKEAERASDPNTAYGLLREARGVIKAIEHMQVRALTPVSSKDEGDKRP